MIYKLSENFHWMTFGIYSIAFGILDATQLIAVADKDKPEVFDFITYIPFAITVSVIGVCTLIAFWPYKRFSTQLMRRVQSMVVAALLTVWMCITIGSVSNHGSSFLAIVGMVTIINILFRAYTD